MIWCALRDCAIRKARSEHIDWYLWAIVFHSTYLLDICILNLNSTTVFFSAQRINQKWFASLPTISPPHTFPLQKNVLFCSRIELSSAIGCVLCSNHNYYFIRRKKRFPFWTEFLVFGIISIAKTLAIERNGFHPLCHLITRGGIRNLALS